MNIKKLSVPLSLTAALAGLVACALSCAKKSSVPEQNPTPPPAPTNSAAESPATNTVPTNSVAVIEPVPAVTNVPAAQEITNPPPAETTVTAPETAPMTATNLPGHVEVVEMPTNPPVAPTNFFPAAMATNCSFCLTPVRSAGNTNFFLDLRGGYDHFDHGDNHDTYRAGAKFYAYGDGWRKAAGHNAWLIPDLEAEIASGEVAKADNGTSRGSDSGLQFRADVTWPWFHWTTLMFARSNSVCPFCQPLTMGLGPTANLGFDHLYNESKYRFARYAGLRLTFNRSGFIEYTMGDTEGLAGTRQQVVTEIPFYESRDGEVRYYVRGLWNRGYSTRADILEGGLFLEMPLTLLAKPDKWGDLVPFGQH